MPENLPKDKKLVSIRQAAEILEVSLDTIRRWDKAGKIHSSRPDGKTRYFSLDEIEKLKFTESMSIGDACKMLEISASTLRRIEKKGLIAPERTEGGERRYSRSTLEKFLNSEYFLRKDTVQAQILEPLKAPAEPAPVSLDIPILPTHTAAAAPTPGHQETVHKVLGARVEDLARNMRKVLLFRKAFFFSGAFIGVTVCLLIFIVTILFFIAPQATGEYFGYYNPAYEAEKISQVLGVSTDEQPEAEPSVSALSQVLSPITRVSLAIVKTISEPTYDEAVTEPTVRDVAELFTLNEDGQIVPLKDMVMSTDAVLVAQDTTLIPNLNAEFVGGRAPGTGPGNIVILDDEGNLIIEGVIKSESVGTAALLDGSVTSAKIADGTITEDDIEDGAISADKLASGLDFALEDDEVTTSKVADSAITEALLADGAVTSSKISNNTITSSDLASTLTFSDGDFLDLSAIVHDDTALQGFRLPNVSSSTPESPSAGEGYLAWDTSGDQLLMYDGSAWISTTGDITGVTTGDGLSGGATTGSVSLSLVLSTVGTAGSTSSNSGLEVGSGGLSLLKGCADDEILKWTDAGGWACATDSGAGSATLTVEEGDTIADATVTNLDFLAGDFDLSESPEDEVNVSLAATLTSVTGVAGDFTVGGGDLIGSSSALTLDTSGAGTISVGSNATTVGICNSAACDTINVGTNADTDTITIGDSTDDLSLADAQWSITGAGAASFVSLTVGGDTITEFVGTGLTNSGGTISTTLGTSIAGSEIDADTIDLDRIADGLSLDADLTFAAGAGEDLIVNKTYTDATSESGVTFNFTASDTSSGTTAQYGLYLDNIASTEGLDASLVLDNSDTDDAVGAALRIIDGGGGFTTIIDNNGTLISGTELNRLDGKDAALIDTNDAVATAITGTGALDAGSITSNFGSIDVGNDAITTTGTVTAGTLLVNAESFTDLTGNGLTISSNALTVNLTSSGTTGSTSSNSGLEVGTGGLTLLKGCTDDQILKWTDAGGWACSSDATGSASNSFQTFDAPSGSDPVADSATDTFTFAVSGTNITITGDSGADSVTFNIDESVLAGAGLAANGSAVDIGAGNGITVAADAVSVDESYGFTFTGANTFTPSSTNDLDINLDADSLLTIDQAFSSSTSANSTTITATNASTSGTQNVLYVDNAASTGSTESLLVLDNSDTDTAVAAAIQIVDGGGGFTTIIDNNGTLISGTELNRLDGKDAALIDTNDAVATAITGTGTLTAGATGAGFTLNFGTSTLSGSIGTANISGLDISDDTNLTATNGITFTGDELSLASSTAGGGLTYTTGVLAVGAGTGISVAADSISATLGTSIANSELDDDTVDFDKILDSASLDGDFAIAAGAGEDVTLNKTYTNNTSENAFVLNLTASDTGSGTTAQYGLYIDNLASTEAADASLVIDNSDTDDAVGAAIRIVDAGGGFTTIIDNAGTLISGAELNRLDGKDAALIDTNDAVATAITGTGTLTAGATGAGFTIDLTSSTILGSLGTSAISGLDISDDTNLTATDGITLTGDQLTLASTTGGAGLTYTSGVLAVGAGTGISVAADSISATLGTSIANSELDDDTIDFDKISDTATLDADTSLSAAAGRELTYAKTFTDATSETGLILNFTASDSSSGTTAQYGLYVDNLASTEGLDAGVVIDNSDTDDAVGAAIRIIDGGGGFTTIIDNAGTLISGAELNRLDGKDAALIDTNDAVATAITGTGTLTAGSTGAGFTIDLTSSTISGSLGTGAISGLDISDDTNLTATDGITLTGDQLTLASTTGGAGLTYTSGVLAVGAGTGISVAADSISATLGTDITNSELVDDTVDFDKITDSSSLDTDWAIAAGAGEDVTVNKTFTNNTGENAFVLNLTASDTGSGTTAQYGLYIDNLASTEAADASLVLDNSDTDDAVGAAIRIVDAGGGFTTIIDNAGTLISGAELNRLDGKDAALIDTNDAVATAITGTGTLTAGATGAGFTLDFGTSTLSGNIGTSNVSGLDVSDDTNLTATDGITLTGDQLTLASTTGGGGLTYTTGVLAVGAGTGISVAADSISATLGTDITNAELVDDTVDFDKINDTLSLDTDTSIAAGAGEDLTFNKTYTNNTSENAFVLNLTASDTGSGTTAQYGLYIDNLASTEAADASLVLDNSDTDDAVGAAIRIVDAGGGFTNIIDNNGTLISGSELNILDSGIALSELSDSGTLTAGTVDINGGNIDGTVLGASSPAAGTFTGVTITTSALAVNSDSITSDGATLVINAGGTVDVQDGLTVDSLTSDTGGVSIAAGQSYTGAGAVTLSSGGSAALTLDSASGTVGLASNDDLSTTGDVTFTLGGTETVTFTLDPAADTAGSIATFTIDGEDTIGSDEAQIGLALVQSSNGTDVTEGADALLTLTNNDANDAVNVGIRFDAGAGGTDFATGIDFDAADVTTEIVLENGESIANQTDNQINLTIGSNGTLLLTSSTAATISNSAGSLILDSNGGTIDINDGTIDVATQATDVEVADNSATAFTISQGSNTYITIDTTDDAENLVLSSGTSGTTRYVRIGSTASSTTPDLLVLDTKSDAGNPTGTSGALFMNSSNKLMINENGTWKELCNKTDAACGAGSGSAWSALTDPTGNLTLSMAEYTTASTWDTAATAATFDALTYSITNDAGTDANVQRVLVLQNNNDGAATGSTEALLVLNNADANEAVADALVITSSGAGGITTGIDFDDTDIVTDIEFQNGETLSNDTDDMLVFTGAGGGDNTDFQIDLDGTHPVISSPTDSTIEIAEALTISGTSLTATSATTVTLGSTGADTITIGNAGADTIAIGGAASTGVSITDDNWSITTAGAGSLASLTINSELVNDFSGSGIAVTSNALTVNLTTSGTTGSTSSNSGLEVGSGGLTLLKGCTDNEILKWTDAGGWACASDSTGGTANIFLNIDTPSGSDPAADSSTDTLALAVTGTNLTITGDSGADSVTFDIVESTLAGAGLVANGSALDVGTGTGISVAADAISVNQDTAFAWTNSQTYTFVGTENLAFTSDLAGSVNVLSITGTPSSTTGTTAGLSISQASSANSNGLDAGLYIDNADADLAIPAAIQIANSGGGGYTNIINNAGTLISGTELNILDGGIALSELTDSGTLTAGTVDINGGNIDGVTIGGASAGAGTFTQATITTGALAVNSDSITSDGATLTINAAGAVDIQDGLTADTLTVDAGNLSVSAGSIDGALTLSGSTSDNSLQITLTNGTSSGTQNAAYIDNAASSGTTEALLVLDNSDTDTAVTAAIQIVDAGGGFTTIIDNAGTLISGAELNRLDGKDAALIDTNDAVATAITGTGTLTAGATGAGFTLNFGTSTLSGSIGTSNISGLDISDDTNLTATNGITLTGDQLTLDSATGGAGLTYTTGVLAVGAGTGISVAADSISATLGTDITNSELVDDTVDFDKITDSSSLDTDWAIAAGNGEDITVNKTFTDATSESGLIFNFTASDSSSGTTAQYGLYVDNLASTEGLDAGVVIDNSDTDDAVGAAIRIVDAGGGFTTIIDNAGTLISGAELNRLDGKDAALVDTNDAVATAITGTGTLTAGATGAGFTIDLTSSTISGSLGTGAISGLDISDDTNLTATNGITLTGDQLTLASGTGGDGLTYTTGVLAVGAGTGISVAADSISATLGTDITNSELVDDTVDFDKIIDSASLDTDFAIAAGAGEDVTLNKTYTNNTGENAFVLNLTASDTGSGTTTQYGLYVDNLASTEAVDASLVLDNSDTDDAVGAAIRIVDAGGGFTTIIDNAGTLISGAELNRLDGKDAALVDTNDAVATAITGTGTLTAGATGAGFTIDLSTSTVTGSITGAIISGIDISDDTNLTATNGITLTGDQLTLDSATGGAGLTYTTGVLAVGAGTGISVAADSISATLGTDITNSELVDDTVDFDKITDSSSLDTDWAIAAGTGEDVTLNKTFTDATSESGLILNFTASDSSSGTTAQYGLYVDNLASTEGLDAGVVIDNSDTDDAVGAAIRIVDAGGGFTTIIDNAGTLISGAELNRLDGKDAALIDTNDAVATAITGTGALDAGSITANFGAINVGSDDITTTGSVLGNSIDRSTGGALTIGDATATSVSICNATACDTISIGTNTDADTITIGEANDDVSLTDAQWSITGAGAASFASVTSTGAIAANSASGITSTQSTLVINAGGAVDVQDGLTVDSATVDNGNLAVSTGTIDGALTLSGSSSDNLLQITLTNSSSSGTQNVAYFDNAASSGTTESLVVIDNSDTDTAVTNAVEFVNAGGGFTNLFNVAGTTISQTEFTILDGGIAFSDLMDTGTLTVTTVDINGGNIDGVTIGGASAGAGTFSSLTSSGDLTVSGGDISGSASDSIDIGEIADATFTFVRNDAGTVTITANDNDTTAALLVTAGGSAQLTLGDTATGTNGDTVAIFSSDWEIDTTGAITGVSFDANGSGNSITNIESADIANDTIAEADFNVQGTLTDEYCLTYEEGGGADLQWQACVGAVEWNAIGDASGDDVISFHSTAQIMEWATMDNDASYFAFNFTNAGTSAGTDSGVVINNSANASASTDNVTENLLLLQQLDTSTGSSINVANFIAIDVAANAGATDGIEITNSGGNLTNAINIADTGGGVISTAIAFSGTFTTLFDVAGTALTASEVTILDSGIALSELTDSGTLTAATVDINGGAIDGVTIGGASAGAGTFSSLTSNGDLTVSGGDVTGSSGDSLDIGEVANSQFTFTINSDSTVVLTSADSTDANTPLTVQSAGTGGLLLDTAGAGTITAGSAATAISICNSTACDTVTIGTNTDADTITIGDSNDNIAITDAQWSISATGAGTFASISVGETISDFSGDGLTVSGGNLAVRLDTTAADGASVTSVSGLELASGELSLLRGCGDGQVLKWDNTNFDWDCANDSTSAGGGATMQEAYDAGNTIVTDATGDITITLAELGTPTGLEIFNQDTAGVFGLEIDNTISSGTLTNGLLIEQSAAGTMTNGVHVLGTAGTIGNGILIEDGSGTLTDAIEFSGTFTNILNVGGTGISSTELTRLDGTTAALVDQDDFISSDGSGSTSSGSGMEAGTGGIGLLQGCSDDQILKWNEGSSVWECASDRATVQNRVGSNYTTTTTTIATPTNMSFSVAASETWIFEFVIQASATTTADHKLNVSAPGSTSGTVGFENGEDTVTVGNVTYGTNTTLNAAANNAVDVIRVNGSAVTTNSGTIALGYAQNAANGTNSVKAASYMTAHKISGADLAEVYYTKEAGIRAGQVVSIDGSIEAGVKKSTKAYDSTAIGIISTQPGLTLGDEPKAEGNPVFVALTGRVPIQVNLEGGHIYAGDYLTTSSTPGVAMKATRAGPIIGQALVSYFDENDPDGVGETMAFVKNGYYNGSSTRDLLAQNITESPDEVVGVIDPSRDILDYFLRQRGEGPVGVEADLSEVVTDRVVAGMEVITPRLIADEIITNKLKANVIEGLEIYTDKVSSLSEYLGALQDQVASLAVTEEATASGEIDPLLGIPTVSTETLDLLTVNQSLVVLGTSTFADAVTFTDKALFESDVEFSIAPLFTNDTAGFAIVRKGADEVTVTFEHEYLSQPVVTTSITLEHQDDILVQNTIEQSLLGGTSYIVTNKSTKGFTIKLASPAREDTTFSWIALAVKNARFFIGEAPSEGAVLGTQPPAPTSTPEPIIEETEEAESSESPVPDILEDVSEPTSSPTSAPEDLVIEELE